MMFHQNASMCAAPKLHRHLLCISALDKKLIGRRGKGTTTVIYSWFLGFVKSLVVHIGFSSESFKGKSLALLFYKIEP
jgi:hypothetical protein